MIKIIKVLFASALFVLSTKVYAHCQVPCGIYGDAVRIVQIEEDITTVRKAMNMINDLAGKSDAQSLNQISRHPASWSLGQAPAGGGPQTKAPAGTAGTWYTAAWPMLRRRWSSIVGRT